MLFLRWLITAVAADRAVLAYFGCTMAYKCSNSVR